MEPEASQDYAPARRAKRGFNMKYALIGLVIVLLLAGGFLFLKGRQSADSNISPTPEPFPTSLPTPEITEVASPSAGPSAATPSGSLSPTKKADVKAATDMSIQILNGSGEVGVAGQVRDFLQGKGYKYFETGNADNFEYQNVSVKVKSSLSTYGSKLIKDLGEKYTIASDSAALPNDSIFDAVVTVGK